MKKLIIYIFLVFQSSLLHSQKIEINYVDSEFYPKRIKVYTTVVDSKGEVICNLVESDFRLTEYEKPREIQVITGIYTETSIGVLIDNSGSMAGVLKDVKEAAKRFIEFIGGTDRACTYSFDDQLHHLHSMIDVSVGKNQSALIKSIDKIKPGGGTQMYTAIAGLIQNEMIAEKDRRKAIVALTDGVSGGSLETALDATSKHHVAVYTIGMGGVDVKTLEKLSKKSGGKFYAVSAKPTKEELIAVYRDIKNRLNCQYTIIYSTPDFCPDGSSVPIEVFIDKFGISKKDTYKRPYKLAQIPLDLFYAPKTQPKVIAIPDDPIECETVQFHTQIQATSCSDSLVLKNVVIRAYDMKPGDRIEVAKSKPVQIQSNSKPKKVIVEWDSTQGFTDEHTIELVIDPVDSVLEINEENNLISTKINFSKAIHDLYIESIDYSPKPASPCEMVTISVKIGDGCTCKGVKSHEIMVEAYDKEQTFGSSIVSVTSGNLSVVKFDWDPQGFFGHKPLTFAIDPHRKFGEEQTRENNKMQALVEVSPVLHELKPTEVTHNKKRFFVGDKVRFNVKIENGGICPGLPMKQNIRVRLKDVQSNRVLAHSAPFSVETQSSTLISIDWATKRNDFGSRELEFTVDAEGVIREKTPPGKTNNSIQYKIEILPMPHDLIIKSATITPEKPIDGDPATLIVIVEDQARFPGVSLKGVYLKAYERYTKALLGKSVPTDMVSQQTSTIQFDIDTGGLAGQREILIKVDPDNKIPELTRDGKDGENNNEYILKIFVRE